MMLILQYKFVKKKRFIALFLHTCIKSSHVAPNVKEKQAIRIQTVKKKLVTTTAKTFRLNKQIQICQI